MANSFESNAIVNASAQSALSTPAWPQNPQISVMLTDENVLMWEQQVEATIWGYGLESHLIGEESPPPQTIQGPTGEQTVMNSEFLAWRRLDQRLAAWLLSSLSDTALILVVGLKTTKDIWGTIQTNFASQSIAKVMQYRLEMQTMKKESFSMKEYLGKMKSYFDILGCAGSKVADRDKILYILGTSLSFESRLGTGALKVLNPLCINQVRIREGILHLLRTVVATMIQSQELYIEFHVHILLGKTA